MQYAALVAIKNNPDADQTTLCNTIALDRSTIGDVVGRLEKRGLISRANGAADRRTKTLRITAAGNRMIRDIDSAVAETQRLILAPLKPGERTPSWQMLKHLRSSQQRAQPRAAAAESACALRRASANERLKAPARRPMRPKAARR